MKRLCIISFILSSCLFAKEDEKIFVNPNISEMKNVHYVTGKSLIKQAPGLDAWIASIQNGLAVGDIGEIVTESNHHILFTNKNCSIADAKVKIKDVLASLQGSLDANNIKNALMQLDNVYRATFVESDGGLVLVEDSDTLKSGDLIWRKNPEGVEKTTFYSEKDLLIAMKLNGLECTEIKRPCFFGNVKYRMYLKENTEGNLGEAYIDANPFTIFTFVKMEKKAY